MKLKTLSGKQGVHYVAIMLPFLFWIQTSAGLAVTSIAATYGSGQVFITWKSPASTGLQYNLYRSLLPITSSTNLSSTTLMGYVRDSSCKNMHRTRLGQSNIFFKISDTGAPLASNTGVYVVTCTDHLQYYYAVTVTTVSNGREAKKITVGKNALKLPIAEAVADPQPVFQDSITWSKGDVVKYYVWFGNNQNLPNFPAMLNCGSYGYNFYIIKRGTASRYPVFVFYEGLLSNSIIGNGLGEFADKSITNCYVIGLDDWLPIPGSYGVDAGRGTFWTGYYENYDIYSATNPVPSTGIDKTYSQTRFIHTIDWANKYLLTDSTRVYTVGVSSGGFGAFMTGIIAPQKIAAVYAVVEPVFVKSYTDADNQMWGRANTNLNCDITNPSNGQPLHIFELMDFKKMALYEKQVGWPLIFSIEGKPDPTIGWQDKPKFFDSVEANQQGGVYYWDQRLHDGTNENFIDTETTPNFYRYQTTKSYPAFANCSVNQDAGDGTLTSGDPYGAINGYLDWNDNIIDQSCKWSATVFVKDFYVGGILDANQYDNCYSDITLRRLQNFHPSSGSTIKWYNVAASGDTTQSGSFLYDGKLLRIQGVRIDKSGSQITFKTSGCNRDEENSPNNITTEKQDVLVIRMNYGLKVQMNLIKDDVIQWCVYDVSGRIISNSKVYVTSGVNEFNVPISEHGIYLLELKGHTFSHSEKIIY